MSKLLNITDCTDHCFFLNSGLLGRSWRTLVRIDDIDPDGKFFYVVVPGWDSQEVVRLRLQDLPENIRQLVKEGQIIRLHARVNLGAEVNEDLYFEDWEPQ